MTQPQIAPIDLLTERIHHDIDGSIVVTDASQACPTRGGYLPTQANTLMLDLSALNRIISINEDDLVITVEAGVTWQQIGEALTPRGLCLPLFGTFSGSRATVNGGLSNGALFIGSVLGSPNAQNR